MNAYKASGLFEMGRNKKQSFTKELIATDEAAARLRLLSEMGSRHGIKQRQITILTMDEIAADQITDQVVAKQLAMAAQ